MLVNEAAAIDTPEMQESYARWADISRHQVRPVWVAAQTLPVDVRPHLLALAGFAEHSDRVAAEGSPAERQERFGSWRAQTLAEVRAGRSDHPLRRALVHTMGTWDLDIGLLEEFLGFIAEDSSGPPAFVTEADQRRFLRGFSGTLTQLWTPLLRPHAPDAARLMSVLGEACMLVDLFEDFPADLAEGRCYLPAADLVPLGLSMEDLRRGERREALDALMEVQVARGRELVRQAAPVAGMVSAPCQEFLDGILLGTEMALDEVERLGGRVLAEGVDALALCTVPPRPCAPAGPEVPRHVAVIMDGNRRWARQHRLRPAEGHRVGARGLVRMVDAALRLGITDLSVFVFSTENWRRPQEELAALFGVLVERLGSSDGRLSQCVEWLHECGVRVRWCGRRDRLEESLASAVAVLENMTSNNTAMSLNVCLDYGGQEELVRAARALAAEAVRGTLSPEEISAEDFARNLYLPDLAPVDLLIRTSAEQRLSNFLPWHLAYAEMVFEPVNWPDFGPRHLQAAVTEYAARQRRFGSDMPVPARVPGPAATR